MLRRLATTGRALVFVLALALALLGHVTVASAMPAMPGMQHDGSSSACAVLCASTTTHRQEAPQLVRTDEDDTPVPALLTAATMGPHRPQRLVAADRFRSPPPPKIPLYIKHQLIRV